MVDVIAHNNLLDYIHDDSAVILYASFSTCQYESPFDTRRHCHLCLAVSPHESAFLTADQAVCEVREHNGILG